MHVVGNATSGVVTGLAQHRMCGVLRTSAGGPEPVPVGRQVRLPGVPGAWVHACDTGYVVLQSVGAEQPAELVAVAEHRHGQWSDIGVENGTVAAAMLQVQAEHADAGPQAFAVAPSVPFEQFNPTAVDAAVLASSWSVHAVFQAASRLVSIVFFEPNVTLTLPVALSPARAVSADQPCALLFSITSPGLGRMTASDPSQTLAHMTVYVHMPAPTPWRVDLPRGEQAGASVHRDLPLA